MRYCNPNLLINAYLADPVNQRSVINLPLEDYGIDCWLDLIGSSVNAVVMNGYLFLPTYHVLSQRLEPGIIIPGQIYTASVLTLEGQLYYGTHVYENPYQPFNFIDGSDVQLYFYENNYFQFRARRDINVVAAKLELGPQQTLAHKERNIWVLNGPPPNKALELIKCQRYYIKQSEHWINALYSHGGEVTISIPVVMASIPTVVPSTNQYFGSDNEWHDIELSAVIVHPSSIDIKYKSNDLIINSRVVLLKFIPALHAEPKSEAISKISL